LKQEHVKFWCDSALGTLELLRATYITHSFAPHTHEGFALSVIVEGADAFTYRGSAHVAPKGSIVVIHPGEVHTGHAALETGWSFRSLYPDAVLLQETASEVAGRKKPIPYFPTPIIFDEQLAQYIHHLHIALETSTDQLERSSHFLWTLAQLVTRHANTGTELKPIGQEHRAVKRIQDYLIAHYAESISLEQLAAIAELSPFHLLRVFRRQVGLPPHAYLTQVRVKEAKTLLALGLPIAQVPRLAGFVDQSHLTKHFKRTVGVTPGQYVFWSNNLQDR
jgi:AraC-like DNA-binding protein